MTPLPRMEVFAKVTSVGAFGRAAAALGIPLTPPPRQAASAGRDAGLLRVDLPDARTRQAMAPLLAAFAARHPGLRFQLSVTPAASPAPDGADLTIRLEPPCDPSWLAHRLGALRARLYAAPEYLARRPAPERPADLAAHDCMACMPTTTARPRAGNCGAARTAPSS